MTNYIQKGICMNNRKRLTTVFVTNIILTALVIYGVCNIFMKPYDEWINLFAVLIAASLSLQIICLLCYDTVYTCISIIFLILSYLFHFSHIFLLLINYDFGDGIYYFLPFVRYGQDITMKSMQFSYCCVYALFLGIQLCLAMPPKKIKNRIINLGNINQFELGLFMFVLSLPIWGHRTLKFMLYTMSNGYAYAANLKYSILELAISNMMLPGLILLITSKCISKRKAFMYFSFGVVLRGIDMFTGQRAYNLMFIVLLTGIYFLYVLKIHIKFKHIIMFGCATYLGLDVMRTIRVVRIDGMSLKLIISTLLSANSNPILDMMNEFGVTENVVAYTYKMSIVPTNGKQIISAFLSIIPGISHLFPNVDWSQYNLAEAYDSWNMGGSFIADAYFDFHYAGIVFCFCFGFFIQKIISVFVDSLKKSYIYDTAWISLIFCEFIFCVRSSTYKIPRQTIIYTLLFWGIVMFYSFFKEIVTSICFKIRGRSNENK